jgi:hypothetical protein
MQSKVLKIEIYKMVIGKMKLIIMQIGNMLVGKIMFYKNRGR